MQTVISYNKVATLGYQLKYELEKLLTHFYMRSAFLRLILLKNSNLNVLDYFFLLFKFKMLLVKED